MCSSNVIASTPVVILAGGKGTRLRPFTASFPKPLVPLEDTPILEVVLKQLIEQGFKKVTLCLGHLSELIRAYIQHKPELQEKLRINTVDENSPTGTAGSLATVPGLDHPFIAMNGDVLTNLNYASLVQAHLDSGAAVTIATHSKEVKIDLGVLQGDENGMLTGYIEKPTKNYSVSMGIYVYDPSVLSYIKPGEYLDFPTLVHMLLEDGKKVYMHKNEADWLDIGRPDDYALAQNIFKNEPQKFLTQFQEA